MIARTLGFLSNRLKRPNCSVADKAHSQRGQGMTEYIIIVALIAIGTIAVVTIFGNNVRGLFALSNDGIRGERQLTVQQYGDSTDGKSVTKKDLSGNLGGP